MNEEEQLLTLTLGRLRGLTQHMALDLIRRYGSATAVFSHAAGLEEKARTALQDHGDALQRAREELEFCARKGIRVLCLADADYPQRLRECPDPPLVLFLCGAAELNVRHMVAVVGTRRITEYGKDLCRHFCEDLARLVPDAVVVSGLAYGVDIHAHRAALANGLPTVAVLAHGLDRIYPTLHRDTARQMLAQGGLVTEYFTGTRPDKGNFVRRNRIVAGLADATVVVESAERGGALITARLAQDYNREIFAFPGRASDPYSAGCNALIRDNVAALVTSAEDLACALRWADRRQPREAVQRELFPTLSPEEEKICGLLSGKDSLSVNQLAIAANLPVHVVSASLFELELKGCVKELVGGRFRLQG